MGALLPINDAYIPYLEDEHRTQIFFGGSSSGKSHFLAQRVVIENSQDGRNFLIVRNVAKTIRESVFNEIVKKIYDMGLEWAYEINKTSLTITCKLNRKQILFAGLDNVEKLKSVTPINGVFETVWIEEATETAYAAYKQLRKRLRGKSALKKTIWLSFNPIYKTHWIYKEFFGRWDETKNVYEDDQLLIVKTTYKDNAFLSEEDIYELEHETDRYFYEVYTLGNWGILGKLVFTRWRTQDLTDLIPGFANTYNGLDFGFSADPTAIVRVSVDKARKVIYVFDEFYRCEVYNDELAEVCRGMFGSEYVTCDCAQPGDIGELNRRGVHAIPAKKGAGSILTGINFLKDYEIIVHTSCQNFINEISTYQWAEDAHGNTLPRPIDANNHLMDALRYATEGINHTTKAGAARRIR